MDASIAKECALELRKLAQGYSERNKAPDVKGLDKLADVQLDPRQVLAFVKYFGGRCV